MVLLIFILVVCIFFFAYKKKVVVKKELNAEECISADKIYMAQNYSADFKWYETGITLKDYLDKDGGEIESIENVFQVSINGDPLVIIFVHNESNDKIEEVHSFWIEDFPIDNIEITYQQVLEIINKVNLPKPHSKQCVLRKQVGPKQCNAQYIFGNQQAQLYVDAVTGSVTDKNPAFN